MAGYDIWPFGISLWYSCSPTLIKPPIQFFLNENFFSGSCWDPFKRMTKNNFFSNFFRKYHTWTFTAPRKKFFFQKKLYGRLYKNWIELHEYHNEIPNGYMPYPAIGRFSQKPALKYLFVQLIHFFIWQKLYLNFSFKNR